MTAIYLFKKCHRPARRPAAVSAAVRGRAAVAALGLLVIATALTAARLAATADDREPQTIVDDTCVLALRSIDRQLKQEGYILRADNWTGLLEANDPQVVNSQLFRGHDYLFVLAADPRQSQRRPLMLQVADRGGKVLATAESQGGSPVVLAFKPERTGAYLVVLRLDHANADADEPARALSAFMVAYR